MNESHPTRPPLATIICIYLAVTAFIPLEFMWILLWGWLHSFSNYPSILLLLPHTPMPLVICALALVGTIALWQMHRAAFFLLAARFVLSFAIHIGRIPRLMALFHRMSATMPRAVIDSIVMPATVLIIAEWVISILIVWYVYRITWPKMPATSMTEAEAGV